MLEQSDGSVFSLPPIEIVPAEGAFDYTAKYLLKSTQEICPGRFAPEVNAALMADQVLYSGVACITDLMVKEGLINLDFADVRAIMISTSTAN